MGVVAKTGVDIAVPFVHQLAVPLREAAYHFLELRKSLPGSWHTHRISSKLPIGSRRPVCTESAPSHS
jgi:hypothetical protein